MICTFPMFHQHINFSQILVAIITVFHYKVERLLFLIWNIAWGHKIDMLCWTWKHIENWLCKDFCIIWSEQKHIRMSNANKKAKICISLLDQIWLIHFLSWQGQSCVGYEVQIEWNAKSNFLQNTFILILNIYLFVW